MKIFASFICLFLVLSTGFSQQLKTPTLSPFSKISQEIGLTEIIISYARPSAKGRAVFGTLVPFDKIWRTGANAGTKITLNESARIGGHPIDAGTYAIYTIPKKNEWTIILHANTKLRSLAGDVYKQKDDVFRFKVNSQKLNQYTETFTLQFADLSSDSCTLQLIWENTLINIPIEVEVDEKIESQMRSFLTTPENVPPRTYFEAAQYHLNNKTDLGQAIKWIDGALEKSPKNFRYGLLKSKIQRKNGNSKEALLTIEEAIKWAKLANNANYIGQTMLYKTFLVEQQ